MQLSIQILVGLIAAFHLYVLWIEMFAWLSRGPKVFKSIPKELFPPTKVLAANQGLYNGFLAAGLIWSLFICNPHWQNEIRLFFLSCVALAGIYGGLTAGKRIFFVQAVPALVGIGLVCLIYFHVPSKQVVQKENKLEYYYINVKDNKKTFVTEEERFRLEDIGTLLKESYILVGGKQIGVRLYTNRFKAPIDGDDNRGYIEGIGFVYGHAITWMNAGVLRSNNDSINEIITKGLGRLLMMEDQLYLEEYYEHGRGKKEYIEFKTSEN